MRRRGGRGRGGRSRRAVLLALAGGLTGAAAMTPAESFDTGTLGRSGNIDVTTGASALIGIEVFSPVKKNSRDPLVDVTNDLSESVTVTVSLDDCSQGTLYDPQDDSGCTVTFPLSAGTSDRVDIEASVSGTSVPFTVSVDSSGLSMSANRRTKAEAGNPDKAVVVKDPDKDNEFSADRQDDVWTIKKVQVKDEQKPDNLDRIEYTVTENDGTEVVTRTDSISGGQYQVTGNDSVTLTPDDSSYDITKGQQFQLTVTAYDADGNSDTETVTTIA